MIPVLNEAATIADWLQRLRALVGDSWEIRVVDGGSCDATVEVARSWCDQMSVSAPGRALQMNEGARDPSGDVLLFLHADTQLPQDFAQQMQDFLRCSAQWGRFDVRLDGPNLLFRVIECMMNLRSRLTAIATGDQAIFMRPEFFQRLTGFSSIPLMEDVEFSARARRLSRPFCSRSRVVTSSRRWQRNGIIRTVLLMWWLRLAFYIGVSPQRLHRWYYPSPCQR